MDGPLDCMHNVIKEIGAGREEEDSIEGDCFMALDPLAPIDSTGLRSVIS